jgi:hypothetical protein
MRRVAGLVLLAVLVLMSAAVMRPGVGQTLIGRPSFTKSVEVDRGTFFRLKMKLTYKREAQDFDIVVNCNVRQTNYRDNGRSVDIGMVPEVFGRRMDDGKALVIRPPQACRGETTANGGAPPDLFPMAIVYDNADNLAFGTAYVSEDAYANPLSVLTFGGATIEKATREEFDEFRRTQQNVLTPEMYQRRASPSPPKDVAMWGTECFGYARYRLPDDLRAIVRKHWPASKPRFWEPGDSLAMREIWNAFRLSNRIRSDAAAAPPHSHRDFAYALESTERGLTTRRGGGRLNSRPVIFPPAVYPDADGWGLPPWPRDPVVAANAIFAKNPRLIVDVDLHAGTTKGFGYCRSDVSQYVPLAIDMTTPATNRVNGEEIYYGRAVRSRPATFLESDEFIFERFELGMFTGRGGA